MYPNRGKPDRFYKLERLKGQQLTELARATYNGSHFRHIEAIQWSLEVYELAGQGNWSKNLSLYPTIYLSSSREAIILREKFQTDYLYTMN